MIKLLTASFPFRLKSTQNGPAPNSGRRWQTRTSVPSPRNSSEPTTLSSTFRWASTRALPNQAMEVSATPAICKLFVQLTTTHHISKTTRHILTSKCEISSTDIQLYVGHIEFLYQLRNNGDFWLFDVHPEMSTWKTKSEAIGKYQYLSNLYSIVCPVEMSVLLF